MTIPVYVIATDSAACWWYRLHLPLTHLPADQFEVHWQPPPPAPELPDRAIVVGQRIAGDNPTWLAYCADPRVVAVYEIDDDILDVDPANEIPYAVFQPQREGTIRNIVAANVVTASTPNLARKLRQWNPNVVCLPNCIDPAALDYPDRRRTDGVITVGWGGSPFHAQDFPGVGEQLAVAAGRNRHLDFHMIGANYIQPWMPARSTPWGRPVPEYLASLDFHIGIAPIIKTEFNASKSWLKLLEYGARGIAPIATDWGQYHDWAYSDDTEARPELADPAAVLISDMEELADTIGLLCDHDYRARVATAACRRASQYTIDQHAHRWADAYRTPPE